MRLDNGEEQGAKDKDDSGEKNEGFFASLRMTAQGHGKQPQYSCLTIRTAKRFLI
jgi:hypothetical protein